MTVRRWPKTTIVFAFISLFLFALPHFSFVKALPAETEGTGIVCNPRQGVWSLYQPATSSTCGGEVYVYWSEIEPTEGQYDFYSLKWYLDSVADGSQVFLAVPVTASEGRNCDAPGSPDLTGDRSNLCKGAHDRGSNIKANNSTCNDGCLPNWLESKMCKAAGENSNCWDSLTKGYLCRNDSAFNGVCDTSRQNIVIDGMPIPWNPAYQSALSKTLDAIGQWLNANPRYKDKISMVYASSGGGWGEMNLYSWSKNRWWRNRAWIEQGYTNKKFTEAVYDTMDAYNSAFSDLPISVQLGGGVYCDKADDSPTMHNGSPPGCNRNDHSGNDSTKPGDLLIQGFDGRPGLVDKYGLKMNLRLNGWGSSFSGESGRHPEKNFCDFSQCSDFDTCSLATCSWESGRSPGGWPKLKESCISKCSSSAAANKTSCSDTDVPGCEQCLGEEYSSVVQGSVDTAVSIQSVKGDEIRGSSVAKWQWPSSWDYPGKNTSADVSCSIGVDGTPGPTTKTTLQAEARHIGAQILVKQPLLSVENGQLAFRALFYNRGNRPLFSTRAVGKKWVADSYRLELGFYQGGQLKGSARAVPSRPSYLWKRSTNSDNWAQGRFLAPAGLSSGEYQVKLSLVDPKTDYRWNFFDADGNTSMNEMILGRVTVGPGGIDVQPTQPPDEGECSCSRQAGLASKQRGDFDCSGTVDIADFTIWTIKYVRGGTGGESLSCSSSGLPVDDFNAWLTGYLNSS